MTMTFSALAEQAKTQAPDIPESWKQGRTAYGGLSAGLMLAQARAQYPDLPELRSALVNFTGPVTDAPDLSTELLRQGRNVTTLLSRAEIEGKTVCTSTFSLGAARESHLAMDFPGPDANPPEACESYHPKDAVFVPGFTRNFEIRLIEGSRPLTGGSSRKLRCWARHTDEASRNGEAALLCLADILPPAALPVMTEMGPVSSMTWICNFLREGRTRDGWYQVESDLTAALDGYSSQVMRIWNTDGELIVEGMQSIAIFA